ncbi:hypothetical protein HZA96_05855 [Candidatus Woesearchaeota archaeon]|nr:hypothetical protein [Candidatus Woesearchaeota archaeon]
MPESKKIILDTNFLLIPGQLHVDIFEELSRICNFPYQLFVLDKTVQELKKIIATNKGKHMAAATVALKLIQMNTIDHKLKLIDTKGYPEEMYADTILKELAEKDKEYIIATQDIALRKNFKKYIILRQKKYLELKIR